MFSGAAPLRRMLLILGTDLVWGRAGAGWGCVPRMLGRKPKSLHLTHLAPCDLPPASFPFSFTVLSTPASLVLWEHNRLFPASGPLHMQLPLPRMLFSLLPSLFSCIASVLLSCALNPAVTPNCPHFQFVPCSHFTILWLPIV